MTLGCVTGSSDRRLWAVKTMGNFGLASATSWEPWVAFLWPPLHLHNGLYINYHPLYGQKEKPRLRPVMQLPGVHTTGLGRARTCLPAFLPSFTLPSFPPFSLPPFPVCRPEVDTDISITLPFVGPFLGSAGLPAGSGHPPVSTHLELGGWQVCPNLVLALI